MRRAPGSRLRLVRSSRFVRLITLIVFGIGGGCVDAPRGQPARPSAQPTASPKAAPASSTWLVEDFEQPAGKSGGFRCAFDRNALGTAVSPDPFAATPGGAPPSPGHAARYFGALGDNRAPYSWAQVQVALRPDYAPKDLRAFRSLRFWAKGDGGRYAVELVRRSVTDHDHFKQEFVAGAEWTQIVLPLRGFAQAGWGKQLPTEFDDVEQLQFTPAAHSHPFDLSIDQIELSADEVVQKPVAYDTRDWFAYSGTDPIKRRGTALDVSRLLDAPAGKHGPVMRRGENLGFATGKTIRFWGVNLVGNANFPTHAEADRLAELLAQLGVNLTRHHHMDADWVKPNLFGNGPSTASLDQGALERFDYLVAALQKRGIYQYFDLLVHRKLGPADSVTAPADVEAGFKIEGEFAPQLIELQQKFVEQLMGHRNPYTKRTYASDPAIALVDVINEDSLFWIQAEGQFAIRSPEYRKILSELFSAWLSQHVPGGRRALEQRWAVGARAGQGLRADEDPTLRNVDAVVMFASDDPKRLGPARAADTLRFYYDTSLGYFRRMQAQLKRLGYRGLVTGSNHWIESPIDLYVNAQLDFLDRHAYWAHPVGGWGYVPEISWNPESMLKDTGLGVVGSLATRRVKGLPFVASEWQTSAPNDYRHEGVLVVGAYASLANFNPIEFAFSHDREKHAERIERLSTNFDLVEQPAMLGAWPAVSLLFHRRDVAESKLEAVLGIDEHSVFDPSFHGGAPKELVRLGKTGVSFGPGQAPAALAQLVTTHIKDGVARANDGELVHDAQQGTLQIDTARTQAFAGFKPEKPVELKDVELELDSAFGVVIVTALDELPIATSKHLLVSALGNVVNSGMALNAGRNRLENLGSSPVLVEPIRGRLSLRRASSGEGRVTAFALGPNGERDHAVEVGEGKSGTRLSLSAQHRAMHYEIVRE